MFPIYPVTEASVAPHGGRLVCAVMHDGTRHVGILSGCGKGKLMLNGYPSSFSGSLYAGNYKKEKQEPKKTSSKKKKRNPKNKARSSAKLNALIKPPREPLSPSFPYDTGGSPGNGYGSYGNYGSGYGGGRYGGGYGGGYGAGLALDLALIAFLFLLI